MRGRCSTASGQGKRAFEEVGVSESDGSGVVNISRLTRKVMLLSRSRTTMSAVPVSATPQDGTASASAAYEIPSKKAFLQPSSRTGRRDPASTTFVDLMTQRSKKGTAATATAPASRSSTSGLRVRGDSFKSSRDVARGASGSSGSSTAARALMVHGGAAGAGPRPAERKAPMLCGGGSAVVVAAPERVCHLDKKRKLDEMTCVDSDEIHAVMRVKSAKQALECAAPLSNRHLKFRKVILDWMFESGDTLRLNPLTIHCAIHNFDRVLRSVAVERNVLQLVGLSCLMLAAKVDEVEAELPSTEELLSLVPAHTTKGMLFGMEVTLLEKLSWNLCVLTPRHFVDLYIARGCIFHNDTTSSAVPAAIGPIAGGGKRLDFDADPSAGAREIAHENNSKGNLLANHSNTPGACVPKPDATQDDEPKPADVGSDGVHAVAAVGVTPIRKAVLGNSSKTARAFAMLARLLCGEVVREASFLAHPPALLAAGIVWAGRVALGVGPPWRPELSGLTLEHDEECVRQVGAEVFKHLTVVRPELIVKNGCAREETSSPKGVAELLECGE